MDEHDDEFEVSIPVESRRGSDAACIAAAIASGLEQIAAAIGRGLGEVATAITSADARRRASGRR
jgi:hypothetical protein